MAAKCILHQVHGHAAQDSTMACQDTPQPDACQDTPQPDAFVAAHRTRDSQSHAGHCMLSGALPCANHIGSTMCVALHLPSLAGRSLSASWLHMGKKLMSSVEILVQECIQAEGDMLESGCLGWGLEALKQSLHGTKGNCTAKTCVGESLLQHALLGNLAIPASGGPRLHAAACYGYPGCGRSISCTMYNQVMPYLRLELRAGMLQGLPLLVHQVVAAGASLRAVSSQAHGPLSAIPCGLLWHDAP